MSVPKKVAAFHDIAGLGRSSLTAAIPILSAMGHQVCPVPTAVLSTITGYFENYQLLDLTDFMLPYLNHWSLEQIRFDCVYTGFLASERQAKLAADYIEKEKPALTVVDPVFADDGELYACFNKDITKAMHMLIKKADVIAPNITEAAFLLSKPYVPDDVDAACEYAKLLSDGFSVVITGVRREEKSVLVIVYDAKRDSICKIETPYLKVQYPGTGDIFASALTGCLLSGKSVADSAACAADFVYESIKAGVSGKTPPREGVPFEPLLPLLNKKT